MRANGAPRVADVRAKARAENFVVAPLFLPRAVRRHLLALYGFARLVDDLGDEIDGDRLAWLQWAEDELERAAAGEAIHPVFRSLSLTIQQCQLDLQPFRDLIEANRRDQSVHRYATFEDLVDYCRLSANPVGRVVLAILGATTPERVQWSDDVCTALQVVEHCQDVAEDARRGRVYLPAEDLSAYNCTVEDLRAHAASPALRQVIGLEAARARTLLASGVPLAASLRGRSRVLISGFTAGGLAALDAIAAADNDVLRAAVRPRPLRVVRNAVGVLAAARSSFRTDPEPG